MRRAALVPLLLLSVPATLAAQGVQLPGIGPVNRGMGGASTAAPVNAVGALHWNSAVIAALPGSSFEFNIDLVRPVADISSEIQAGALGPGFPEVDLAGSSESGSGFGPVPSAGLVVRSEDSAWTFGLGAYGIAGYALNYPASTDNPILTPQAPNGLGFGRVFGDLQFFQIAPTVAYRISDRFMIGGAPTITLGKLSVNPAPFAAPDDANGDGFATYPDGTSARWHWGGGFQLGLLHGDTEGFLVGISLKSPQWFEEFKYETSDELGGPRELAVKLSLPLTASLGLSYAGLERWLFALDVRYLDYENTDTIGDDAGYAADGAVTGFGWRSTWAVAVGIQRQLGDAVFLRGGYSYNQNPVDDSIAFFNVGAPLITEHAFNLGATFPIGRSLDLHATIYRHATSSVTGPYYGPAGPIPGTAVKYDVSAESVSAGLTVKF